MIQNEKTFLRKKIYENLDYQKQPSDYSSKIPWIVQQQIAATNGIHYQDKVGKLKEIPFYKLPVPKVKEKNKLMLDIGFGWGRWLISAAERGYIPIGLDIRLEFAKTARYILDELKIKGYVVVADLENIPFQDSIFDLVWSFSVLQHTHYKRLVNNLQHINRVLKKDGFAKLQFPNKDGIRNKLKYVTKSELKKDDINSWVVRYYTIKEYKELISRYLKFSGIEIHSFFGIGVLPEDVKYVSLKNKILVSGSIFLTLIAKILGLKKYADSIYITARPKDKSVEDNYKLIKRFLDLHFSFNDNLNIVPLLKCPISGGELIYDDKNNRLISKLAGVYYPVVDRIPILVATEAKRL